MMDQYTHFNTLSDNGNLFISEMDEGRMTKIKNRLTNKDYLSGRCIALGLDRYILFGEDDHDDTMDPKEDVIEAIIGAAAAKETRSWPTAMLFMRRQKQHTRSAGKAGQPRTGHWSRQYT